MPNKDKFYQKWISGKRKIAFLKLFFDKKCSIHSACPGVTSVHSKWAAGVQYPFSTCRFVIHAVFTYRIVSPWAGASAPALFLCSPIQGGCLTPIKNRTGVRPIFLTHFAEQGQGNAGVRPWAAQRGFRQGRTGGCCMRYASHRPPFSISRAVLC